MQLNRTFLNDITQILLTARQKAQTVVNQHMIDAYWEIGRRIVEEEMKGQGKAAYRTFILRRLAEKLTAELGKGLDARELRKMRQFYQYFPTRDALRPALSWSHYRVLLRVEDPTIRSYYSDAAATAGWPTRVLERNIQTLYYERIIGNQLRKTPSALPVSPPQPPFSPESVVKDPYLFDFLGIDLPLSMSESDLETALIGKIQQFLLEMGHGFAFVARQLCIKTDTSRYYIDLVFYNIVLKCYVIADLKLGALTHQDIGQMDMYLRMFEDLKKIPGDNPTIGIILCTEKDDTLVKYSVLDENKQLFASTYRLVLPTEEDLSRQLTKLNQSL